MPVYNPTLAASLQALAARAISPLSAVDALPGGWSLINLITGNTAQGLFAVGMSGSTPQIALALGAQWPSWLVYQAKYPALTLSGLQSFFFTNGGSAGNSQFDLTVQQLYSAMRPTLMTQLQQAITQVPAVSVTELLVTGQGIGAALAQLAAFDLRAQNAASGYQFATVRCYAFSAPALANTAFQTQFYQQIPDSWGVLAAGNSTVDFFPSAPAASSGFVPLGTAQTVSASVPSVDGPWWERSGVFYGQAFAAAGTGSLASLVDARSANAQRRRLASQRLLRLGASRANAVAATPSGYSADTATTLASLIAVVDQLAQHPTLPLNIPQPWTLVSTLPGAMGAVFSATALNSYAVAFRSGVSYAESASMLSVPGPYGPDWLPAGAAVHRGGATVYEAVQDALCTQLAAFNLSGATLYVAGHSLGAITAVIASGALVTTPVSSDMPVPVTYAIGAPAAVAYGYANSICTSQDCPLQTQTYLVVRDRDTVAPVTWSGLLTTFGNTVTLTGTTSFDDEAFHSLPSYLALLNPGA